MSNISVVKSDSVIVSMTRASQALAEAVTISQTKTIVDVAHAAEIYSKRHHLSEEAIHHATAVKVEATRKLGEILKATPKATGEIRRGTKLEPRETAVPTLEELGLTKKESAVAQKLASLPEKQFEEVRAGNISIAKAIAAIDAKPKAEPAKPAKSVPRKPVASEEDYVISDDELIAATKKVQTENDLLHDTIKSLQVTDKDAEIKKLQERIYGLEGRLHQAIASEKAMEEKLKYHSDLIHKLRKVYGVETHKEILAAAQAQVA